MRKVLIKMVDEVEDEDEVDGKGGVDEEDRVVEEDEVDDKVDDEDKVEVDEGVNEQKCWMMVRIRVFFYLLLPADTSNMVNFL